MVERIPGDRLFLSAVNDWFELSGSVANVVADPPTAKASVIFAERDQT